MVSSRVRFRHGHPVVPALGRRRRRHRAHRARQRLLARSITAAPGRVEVCGGAGMINAMSIEVVYTTDSTATGGGRDGHVKSSDGRIDLDTRPPKAAGGSGEGTNPEQLFSAGYAACFLGAVRLVARTEKI